MASISRSDRWGKLDRSASGAWQAAHAARQTGGHGLSIAVGRAFHDEEAVTPAEPATFGGIFAVLGAMALVAAAYVPARRASRLDLTWTLRGGH